VINVESLTNLRKKLRPIYGEHTDSVISLIGLNHHPEVLNAARRRDLEEAGAITVSENRPKLASHLACYSGDPNRKFTNVLFGFGHWKRPSLPVPEWFAKPVPTKIRRKPKNLEIDIKDVQPQNCAIVFRLNDKHIGSVDAYVLEHQGKKVLFVSWLQTHSWDRKSNQEARAASGWKHVAMEEIEKLAKKYSAGLIFYPSGVGHFEQNAGDRSIHEEILDTYGRLPMRHGYRLKQFSRSEAITSLGGNTENLWWVKRVK